MAGVSALVQEGNDAWFSSVGLHLQLLAKPGDQLMLQGALAAVALCGFQRGQLQTGGVDAVDQVDQVMGADPCGARQHPLRVQTATAVSLLFFRHGP